MRLLSVLVNEYNYSAFTCRFVTVDSMKISILCTYIVWILLFFSFLGLVMSVNVVLSQMLSCMMISCSSCAYCYVFFGLWGSLWFSGFCFTNFYHFCTTELTAWQPKQTWQIVLYGGISLKINSRWNPTLQPTWILWRICLQYFATLLNIPHVKWDQQRSQSVNHVDSSMSVCNDLFFIGISPNLHLHPK